MIQIVHVIRLTFTVGGCRSRDLFEAHIAILYIVGTGRDLFETKVLRPSTDQRRMSSRGMCACYREKHRPSTRRRSRTGTW